MKEVVIIIGEDGIDRVIAPEEIRVTVYDCSEPVEMEIRRMDFENCGDSVTRDATKEEIMKYGLGE